MAKIELLFKTPTKVTVTTAGTRVPLSATSLLVLAATVQFNAGNVGSIYIGENDVTSSKCLVLDSSTPALNLEADDTASDEDQVVFDLSKIYIDSANNGDSVFLSYTIFGSVAYNG